MPYQAIIFDMDGLIVDSEPLWRQAEIAVFQQLGVPLTDTMCQQTMGMRIDEVSAYWRRLYPWQGIADQQVAEQVVSTLIDLIPQQAQLLPGVHETLAEAKKQQLTIALASSSPIRLIHCFLQHFNLQQHFEYIHSAQWEDHGKPHPATYLSTSKAIDVHPSQCLALEDSFRGLLAAKAAQMSCVVVPAVHEYSDPRWAIADAKHRSLLELVACGWPSPTS